jgi:hypothetical protein
MKIPKTFVPNKNLDRKTKELNEQVYKSIRNVTLEELMENKMQILYGNVDIFKRGEIEDRAIEKILEDTYKGLVKWEQDLEDPEKYTAHATVLNVNMEAITIPVLFRTDDTPSIEKRWGYLHLGNKDGPLLNTNNPKIDELACKYFKIDLRKKKIKNPVN